ncbi:hypothetical protein AGMMS50222_10090 [Endomicrobiia bacterium]|nr:hypothetical protein AGMMS49556_10010 [Endomicrobiia bacterium]GHT76896.1 hypothetical protein AGMMS50222_10090 [Endomicrobiia bacterium]
MAVLVIRELQFIKIANEGIAEFIDIDEFADGADESLRLRW